MKRIILLLVLATAFPLYTHARSKPPMIGDPPVIPGISVTASIGEICPLIAPVQLDANGDGIKDLLVPSYHDGYLKQYQSFESNAARFFWDQSFNAMKGYVANQNFKHSALLEGKSHNLVWSFEAQAMIDGYNLSEDGDLLFISSHDDHLYALDLKSGRVIWKHDLEGNLVGVSVTGQEIVAATVKNAVLAFDPSDGSVIWKRRIKAAVMVSPRFRFMLGDGPSVFVSSLDDKVYALNRATGDVQWVFESRGNPSLRIVNEGLLVVADYMGLVALETGSGKVRWRLDEWGFQGGQTVLVSDDMLLFFNGYNEVELKLLAVDVREGKLLWQVKSETVPVDKSAMRLLHAPGDIAILRRGLAVHRDSSGKPQTVYLADFVKVMAIRVADGEEIWSTPIANTQLIALAGDRVLVTDKKKVVRCFSALDGKLMWRHKTNSHIFQMERMGDTLLAILYSHELLALSMATGEVEAEFKLGETYRLVRDTENRMILCAEPGSWILSSASSSVEETNTGL